MNGFQDKVGFIWSVADLLRGDYKPYEYGRVILPLVLLRRLDCVLAPTKEAVLAEYEKLHGKVQNVDPVLNRVARQRFHNKSKLDFPRLLADPNHIAGNLRSYINAFSPQARDTFEKFGFDEQITRLDEAGLLYLVISRFCEIDLHPDKVSNLEMGYIFEELVRRFSEQSNETAGEHFTVALYNKNRLSVTRQLRYSPKHTDELDLTLFVNGLPVATAELKHALAGQTVTDAIAQYRTDRDPKDLLLQFKKRALVHFAVDSDEVYMTTRLAREKTTFLPFNKGRGTGAGNPHNPGGYRTAYLWEEVWERDSWLDILARFIHIEKGKALYGAIPAQKENVIFPRYHQLDAVRKTEAQARAHGTGHNYLIQHSAGSGKSNSIAWLAHRLANLHNTRDEAVFDSVIVVTDRRVLDKQLQDTIYQFEHKQGVVEKIDQHSGQLAYALEAGKRIIITTLQKFPFVLDRVQTIAGRRFAVIVDEAHGSQTGESAKTLKEVLSLPYSAAADALSAAEQAEAADEDDVEDEIARSMAAPGRQPHISFFAFTATPKFKTLATFGTPGPDGKPQPFHLYSMRQAIEEGFILDVLKSYVTYTTFFKLAQAGRDDPEVDARKAGAAIARFVSLHPHNVAQKIEVIVEHFRTFSAHKIGGKAKAMVVTRSRLHAIRYKQAPSTRTSKTGATPTSRRSWPSRAR